MSCLGGAGEPFSLSVSLFDQVLLECVSLILSQHVHSGSYASRGHHQRIETSSDLTTGCSK